MTDTPNDDPPNDHAPGQPPSHLPPPGSPAYRRGAPRADAVPRMETVRLTAPDLKRRGAMEKTRRRLVFSSIGFGVL